MPVDAPDLPLSSVLVPRLEWLSSIGSTNGELVARAAAQGWPDLSVVATDDQTAGRGRLGRSWVAPAGSALAVSILLRPRLPIPRLGWLPLIAGLAVARAADRFVSADRVSVKWPNDVLVGGRKLSGVLSELTTDGAVVVGAGVNTAATAEDLPVPTATSLAIEGATLTGPDPVLSAYLEELLPLYRSFVAAGGDATTSGVRAAVSERCATIGSRIRLELPGDIVVHGTALGIDTDGRLVVQPADGSGLLPVAAGDVTHVRPDAD
ncbi:biotin--[acetyl-CoA-carboxylase] ligase [Labedella populi]|uniref:biotin--[biotin carboxyl-carrier protein] ligase n=1 Tax=Labedella populi TaxID=2498850 RepID=A0A3S4A2T9_9MICO|nr:biotin--[acetyl-CoA-carboxylase] ligase [Labedella populi]RWZ68516.1 biotin--[acetyl-CoA-carboxylase] ligase [Labedella populi]